MKICNKCILPETFPGIRFNDHGICNHCQRANDADVDVDEKKSEYHDRLDQLIKNIKGSSPSYDVIMAYSGGKDSSYTLKLLRERYDLKILAFTFDNHFVSPTAWNNINTICDIFSVDLIKVRPPWPTVKELFRITAEEDIFSPATLLRASSVCTACISIVKGFALKTAIEMSIPMVAFGWSPGQAPIQSAIMKTNPALIRQNQDSIKKSFPAGIFSSISQYFLPLEYYEKYKDRFPINIHPLAFFDYSEKNVTEVLKNIGWRLPDDTDTNSSNCLLNAYANQQHIERNKFHPYVWEIAGMVRQGVMERDEGIEKIYAEQNQNMVKYAKDKLGFS